MTKAGAKKATGRPPKPIVIEPQLDRIPEELQERDQWVCWRCEWKDEKWTKAPYNPESGRHAKTNDPETWHSFKRVAHAYEQARGRSFSYDGVGYVFTADDPYTGVDFDHCFVDDGNGAKVIKPDAAKWIEQFNSYTEYSVSGNGLHAIVKAKPRRNFKNDGAGRELYDKGRYFTFTGNSYHDEPKPIEERREVAEAFIAAYAPKVNGGPKKPPQGKWQPSGKVPLLTLDAINYDQTNSFETWKAELGVKISGDSTATINNSGNVDCRGYCHAGQGATGLFFNPQANDINCNKGCDLRRIGQAFEMRPMPGGKASGARAGGATESGGEESQPPSLIELALEAAELFHDAGGDCYTSVNVGAHRETYKVGSRAHKEWLARLLWEETGAAARSETLSDAVRVLRAKALFDGAKIEAHVRIAEHDGAIYLDLCDDEWRQVGVAESGWGVIASDKSPVRFVRAKGMLPLPEPERGGSISELRELLNLPEDDRDNWPLIVGWLIAAFKPSNAGAFDYPILAIHGEQGSAKSSAQRILRDLIDPNRATLRAAPRDERDLAITAAHGRVVSCDNLTHISEALSNAFCRLSTGGGFATRELYTDDGEVIFDAQRPVIINGIAEVITKSDLLDRAMLVYLPTIPKGKRWRKRVFTQKFNAARPRILGALLDAVSVGLKRMREGIKRDEWPRMSDFAEWAIACEPALGLADGDFIAAYIRNIERADDLAIEASPLAQEIIAMIDAAEDNVWSGTIGELLKALNERLDDRNENPKKIAGWPQSARGLGAKLKELAPNLRRLGVEVQFCERTTKGYTLIIARTPEVPNNVHNVHNVHTPNETNDLGYEHCNEHLPKSQYRDVHSHTPAEVIPAPNEHLDDEHFGNVHSDVHNVNDCTQRPNEHYEHCEHLSEPCEDHGAKSYDPATDTGVI